MNIGTNRWSVKAELGLSKEWGAWTVEVAPSVTVFTDNNDFFNGGTLEQEPLYAAQGVAEFTPWVTLVLAVVVPPVFYVAALLLGRGRVLSTRVLVFAAGLAATAATSFVFYVLG